ncbi:hypothetical protein F7725_020789 [Dissostichus mawsoni]|uniref:BICD family-like cargo adapter 1 n=1 Tax=Dissostichus mawsoni TaxID=36200 RepID=A0A7J5YFH3_DISMA|nr:hypothetical protein F7725_020789 [Dissostichus mawsoni]
MDRLDDWSFKTKKIDLEEDFYFDYESEEMTDYQDPNELVTALKQKEEEVILAAQLGNALLLENCELKERSDKLHEQYADKLEALEQGRHELRQKLEGCQSQWESQVGELERDVRELSSQVERLTRTLSEAERDKSRAELEHSEHTQRLRDQLNTAMAVERAMSGELQALKQELQQKGRNNRPQDEELISAMREQVLRLTQKEQVLEERIESVCQENADLRASLASLQTRLALHDQLKQQHSQQLSDAWQEVEAAQGRSQQLQAQVEELQEEVSLQEGRSHGETSLLSELESSLETARWESAEKRNGVHPSVTAPTDPAPEQLGGSEVAGQQEDLKAMLLQLKGAAQTITQASSTQELNQAFVVRTGDQDQCGNPSAAEELRDQNVQLQQENSELRQRLQSGQEQTEFVQQSIKDRDEAIARKNLMEAELVRSKNDMMSLNNQLLEAIQRKLELSQELEAWQDDIQIIINQQLKSQHQLELPQKKSTSNGMSFFRRPSRTTNAWSSDANQGKTQTPWRDWLRRGKGANNGQ